MVFVFIFGFIAMLIVIAWHDLLTREQEQNFKLIRMKGHGKQPKQFINLIAAVATAVDSLNRNPALLEGPDGNPIFTQENLALLEKTLPLYVTAYRHLLQARKLVWADMPDDKKAETVDPNDDKGQAFKINLEGCMEYMRRAITRPATTATDRENEIFARELMERQAAAKRKRDSEAAAAQERLDATK